MRVLFINRDSFDEVKGGDTVQMKCTANELKKLGVEIDIYSKKNGSVEYENYDLIHFYNITRPAELLAHLNKTNTPIVVSTIFVDYSFYKNLPQLSTRKWVTKILGSYGIEYAKALAKHILRKEKLSYKKYFVLGQRKSISKILSQVNWLLPNSENEYQRFVKKHPNSLPYTIIPNGVDINKFSINLNINRKSKQVLCVAMIEPRKNQLNLIKALNNTDYNLIILGNHTPNHASYYKLCRNEAAENISFLSRVSMSRLNELYLESEIHILPSWFETTGLVSLEAAYLGCKIVVSPEGDTKDYFKNLAKYCTPGSIESIRKSIDEAHKMEYTDELRTLVLNEYNWQQAAKKTHQVYEEILNKKG